MSLNGVRVFLVEDEPLILMTLEDMLGELGCVPADTALSIEEALSKVPAVTCDLAILDVNVGGKRIDPVATALVDRGIPVVFASGYQKGSLPQVGGPAPLVLPKPYSLVSLQAVISQARQRIT